MLVLWFLALISIAAYSLTGGSRFIAQEAATGIAMSQARHAAEAAIWQTVFELTHTSEPQQWSLNGTGAQSQIMDAQVGLSIQDQRGLVDLNGASVELLELVLSASGESDLVIREIAAAIIDWRDPNHERDGFDGLGAEDADYQAAGSSYEAKDGPFHVIDELQQVMGVTTTIYDAVAPYITVHGQTRSLQWANAPSALRQLRDGGVGPEQTGNSSRGEFGDDGQPLGSSKQLNGAVLEIAAHAQIAGAAYNSSAVVLMDSKAPRGFNVLEWREGYATPTRDADTDSRAIDLGL